MECKTRGEKIPTPHTSGGFTLLEVMIAMAIVSIALVSLLALGNRSIGVNARLQKITQATLLAQEKMTDIEVRGATGGVQLVEEEGVLPEPFAEFRWRTAYEETPLPSVRMVTVTVAWGEEARNEAVQISSFLFQ
ncbi:type II secretion system protein GspI [Desulfuromonas soudanensis]|uniref:Type II secretion system protein I n=1 Tax=Desulfuromonas soudanensis TaxID=1603606 RepID=A0A0M3QEZ8_9BACT|nr:type II secretion system minor pseudopilin GspI [Desulfuromonas soudanensis]ALC15359.1 type II secretion system protein GspI [Desulfuromonas soudanensis]